MAGKLARRKPLAFAVVLLLVSLGVFGSTGVVSAHERRTVAGKYVFVVGFLEEPALLNQLNGVSLQVTDAASNQSVTGVDKSLRVEVIQGATKKEFALQSRFGVPGGYTASLIPTKVGTYSFRFFGEISGNQINEAFESGPGRFDDVVDTANLEFPVPRGASGGADTAAQVTQLGRQVTALDRSLQEAQDGLATARTIGFGGVVAGIAGLALAAFALAREKVVGVDHDRESGRET